MTCLYNTYSIILLLTSHFVLSSDFPVVIVEWLQIVITVKWCPYQSHVHGSQSSHISKELHSIKLKQRIFKAPLSTFYIKFYKITKIVCTLWLAARSVCMRVCKHGCGVKLFGFSRANHASTNLKKFSSSKLDKFTLFTHSFVGWNLENRYKEGVSIFLRLSWHFKWEKSIFWKASFCKTTTDYAGKTSRTRLCNW